MSTWTRAVLVWLVFLASLTALVLSIVALTNSTPPEVPPVSLVYTVGPNPYNPFATLALALAAAEQVATATTPVLIALEAGTYDATATFNTPFVNLRGASADTTFLTGTLTVGSSASTTVSAVTIAADATLAVEAGGSLTLTSSTVAGTVSNSQSALGLFALLDVDCASTGVIEINGGLTVTLRAVVGQGTVQWALLTAFDATFSYTVTDCQLEALNCVNTAGVVSGAITLTDSELKTLSFTGSPTTPYADFAYVVSGSRVHVLHGLTDSLSLTDCEVGTGEGTITLAVPALFTRCVLLDPLTATSADTVTLLYCDCHGAVTASHLVSEYARFRSTLDATETLVLGWCRNQADVTGGSAGSSLQHCTLDLDATLSLEGGTNVISDGDFAGKIRFMTGSGTLALTGGVYAHQITVGVNCSAFTSTNATHSCPVEVGVYTPAVELVGGMTVTIDHCRFEQILDISGGATVSLSHTVFKNMVLLTVCTTTCVMCSSYSTLTANAPTKPEAGAFFVSQGSFLVSGLWLATPATTGQFVIATANSPFVYSTVTNVVDLAGGGDFSQTGLRPNSYTLN